MPRRSLILGIGLFQSFYDSLQESRLPSCRLCSIIATIFILLYIICYALIHNHSTTLLPPARRQHFIECACLTLAIFVSVYVAFCPCFTNYLLVKEFF